MTSDWSFARRPFWLFSHVFAVSVVVLFVFLGLWQLDQHRAKAEVNRVIESRTVPPAQPLADVVGLPPDEIEFQLVEATGRFVDDDLVRVANRSQGGVAGQHLVSTFRLDDGTLVLVNRGFVPLNTSVSITPIPDGQVQVSGWVRLSATRGLLGATDDGTRTIVPRLDVDAIGARLDEPVAPVWLQLAPSGASGIASFPDPLDPPEIDPGPHFSYMVQWFIFATLGVAFYVALLRRTSRRPGRQPDQHPLVDQAPGR